MEPFIKTACDEFKNTVGMLVLKDMEEFEKATGEPAGEMDIEEMISERGANFLKEKLLSLAKLFEEMVENCELYDDDGVHKKQEKPTGLVSKADLLEFLHSKEMK